MSTHGSSAGSAARGVSERGHRSGSSAAPATRQPPARATAATKPTAPSTALKAALDTDERAIRREPLEHAIVRDAQGGLIARERGTNDAVYFEQKDLARMRGATFTHNHPGRNSLSPDDIRFACRWGLAEMRCVTSTQRYSVKPPTGQTFTWKLWQTTLKKAYDRIEGEVDVDFAHAVRRGLMTEKGADGAFRDEIMRRLAAETGVRYTRTPFAKHYERKRGG